MTMRRDRSIKRGATSAGTCSDVATAASRGAQSLRWSSGGRPRTLMFQFCWCLRHWLPGQRASSHLRCEECIQSAYAPKTYMVPMQSRLHVHRRTSASAGARLATGILHTAACPHPTRACYLSASWLSALSISFFYARVPNLAPEVAKTKLLTLMTSETLTTHAHPHDCSTSA